MKVNEIITLAQHAELKQLAVKDEPLAIIGFMNMGILEIHKRFKLLQQEAVITVVTGVNEYVLDDADANVQLNLRGNQYLKVDSAYDQDDTEIAINKITEPYSLSIPAFNIINIPDVVIEDVTTVKLTYRAAPNFLLHDQATIPLPAQFFEALLHYIGYRGHSSLQGGKQFENNTHYNRFEASCARISEAGLFIEENIDNNKFYPRGFV